MSRPGAAQAVSVLIPLAGSWWVDPPFTAGKWVPDLVIAAGGVSVSGRAGQRSVETSWDRIVAQAPDVVLVAPCGFHLPGTIDQARDVAVRFPDAEVWAILLGNHDGEQLFGTDRSVNPN